MRAGGGYGKRLGVGLLQNPLLVVARVIGEGSVEGSERILTTEVFWCLCTVLIVGFGITTFMLFRLRREMQ